MANSESLEKFLNNSPELNRNRIEEFKKEFNFLQKINAENKLQVVKADWLNLIDALNLTTWNTVEKKHDVVIAGRTKGFNEYKFHLTLDNKILFIKITDALTPESAQDVFFRKLDDTSLPEIFYKASAKTIGTFSVEDSNPKQNYQNYVWLYHNIVMDISSKNFSTIEISARAIQSFAESKLVTIRP